MRGFCQFRFFFFFENGTKKGMFYFWISTIGISHMLVKEGASYIPTKPHPFKSISRMVDEGDTGEIRDMGLKKGREV